EADVFGEAPNIAARVQAAAEPGTVVITDAVQGLVSGLFVVESRGASGLKGIERPLQLHRIVQPSGVRGRLEAAAAVRGLTPFVGREDELRSLITRWERSREGEGQVALIIGEAGIGKSRLLQRFHELISDGSHAWLEAAAAPFFQNTPFHAIAELLRQLVGPASLPAADEQAASDGKAQLESNERLEQLESALVHAGLKVDEAIPLLAPLINLPASAKYPPPRIPPEHQRRRLLAMLVEWVLGAARALPLVILIEDLHWADASTLEVVQLLAEQGTAAHLLVLCTARPEFHPPWPLRAHHTQITLNRLNTRNVRDMVAQIAARNALANETLDAIVERTSGVPLFVEELTRAVLEKGGAKLSRREIPVTLHDSLLARLDRLGSAKEVLQIGSVIGSEFSYELLRAVYSLADEDLQRELRVLTDADLLNVRGIAPQANYQFKHALIRDAAYEALLKSRRRELHRLVARSINEKFPVLKNGNPEVIAWHWTEAGETECAIAEWYKAGKAAEVRSAFKEGLENYQHAVELLGLLPGSSERDLHELELRQSLVRMFWITRGYSAAETVQAIESTARLAEKMGKLAEVVNLMVSKSFGAPSSPAMDAFADQLLEIAVREGSPTSLAFAHTVQAIGCYYRGDLGGFETHFTACLAFFDDPAFRQFPGLPVSMLGAASLNAWVLGNVRTARKRDNEAMASADRNNPYDKAVSGMYGALLRCLLREYEQAEVFAARTLYLSEEHQLPWLAALCLCYRGQACAQLGRLDEGVSMLRQGIKDLVAIESAIGISNIMAYLASAQELDGDIEGALQTVDKALEASRQELFFRPEVLRTRGELLLKQAQTVLADADFRESISLARSMGAKAWELRTTISLARLLSDTGRRDEARTTLAEIYNGFTEGFDTADLKEAKALLDQLSA
ncbi:MAG: AAA family ATPase, partial [Deltaproteobacteria bacterium]|nr:AAA family ATPase [Deltaproteobacteria bacterium]